MGSAGTPRVATSVGTDCRNGPELSRQAGGCSDGMRSGWRQFALREFNAVERKHLYDVNE
jgi:hypothetical protein